MSKRTMTICGTTFDSDKLMSQAELLEFLRKNGESDRALSHIRERYFESFENELIWPLPCSDGDSIGIVIVAVQEGFLSLPYDSIDIEEYELFATKRATLLKAIDVISIIGIWRMFSDDLSKALGDMLRELGGSSGQ